MAICGLRTVCLSSSSSPLLRSSSLLPPLNGVDSVRGSGGGTPLSTSPIIPRSSLRPCSTVRR
eukprot:9170636-Pyramimonas_sp.AAC.1